MEGFRAVTQVGGQAVARVMRVWLSDPQRLSPVQSSLVKSVVVRHNRIRFARKPWDWPRGTKRGGPKYVKFQ